MRIRDRPLRDLDSCNGGCNGFCNGSRREGERAGQSSGELGSLRYGPGTAERLRRKAAAVGDLGPVDPLNLKGRGHDRMIKGYREVVEEAASSQDSGYRELVTEPGPNSNDVGSDVQANVVKKSGGTSRTDNPAQGGLCSVFDTNTDSPPDAGVKETVR